MNAHIHIGRDATNATSNRPGPDFPPLARAVLLMGLAGSFLANLASQFAGGHFGASGGIATGSMSWVSATYTMATFVGMVAASPLEQRLGMRRYFIASALVFATLEWLQAATPSFSILIALRAFEGFTTGGFGPKVLLAAFILHRAKRHRAAPAVPMFLALVSVVLGLVMIGASESLLGLRAMSLVQSGFASVLALAGLRWLPRMLEQPPREQSNARVAREAFSMPGHGEHIRRRRRIRRRSVNANWAGRGDGQ